MKNFTLRLPDLLRDWIKEKAESNNRSMNGELIAMIKKAKEKQEQKEIMT